MTTRHPAARAVPGEATAGGTDPWAELSRATGVFGLATFVLVFTPIIAQSSLGEPPFTATEEEAATFLSKAGAPWVQTANAALAVAAVVFLWFVVGLSVLLGRAEGAPPWRSAAALVTGVVAPLQVLMVGAWGAASFRGSETAPGLARFAFDLGNLVFANAWVALGSFALACGWVMLRTRMVGAWLAWPPVVAGVGLVVARFVWTSPFWFAPYFVFWIWVIALSVGLIRRGRRP